MKTLIEAIPSIVLLAFAANRLPDYRSRPGSQPLTNILLLIGAGQALRIHAIFDDRVNPILHDLTGVWNISCVVAQCLGVAACVQIIAVALQVQGVRVSRPAKYALAALPIGGMVTGFLLSPATEHPTHLLSETFPAHGPLLVYWVLYLGTIATSVSIVLLLILRLGFMVKTGPLAKVLLAAVFGPAMGALYCIHKALYLVLRDHNVDNWYTRHTQAISLVAVVLPLIGLSYIAWLYLRAVMPARIERYKKVRAQIHRWEAVTPSTHAVLQSALIPRTRRAAWRASRNALAAHRMMVEIVDAAAIAQPPSASSRQESRVR